MNGLYYEGYLWEEIYNRLYIEKNLYKLILELRRFYGQIKETWSFLKIASYYRTIIFTLFLIEINIYIFRKLPYHYSETQHDKHHTNVSQIFSLPKLHSWREHLLSHPSSCHSIIWFSVSATVGEILDFHKKLYITVQLWLCTIRL